MVKKVLIFIVLLYLRIAAKIQIAKIKPKIIGIAGSSGKTSLTQLATQMLLETYTVKQSKGQNSETGIPLSILDITIKEFSYFSWLLVIILVPFKLLFNWKKYDIYVMEMGIDSPVEPKNMSYLLKIIQPIIGVVTNVSLEHSVNFEPFIDEINPDEREQKILALTAEQETMLLTTLPQEAAAIVNIDDQSIFAIKEQIVAKKITISLEKDADLTAKEIKNSLAGFSLSILYQGKTYPLTIQQPLPRHFSYEILSALGIALALSMPLDTAISSLKKNFSLPAGRFSIFKGINDTVLIDSTYNNATLRPILDILDFLKESKKRKIAILGDMRELGDESQDIHEAVAKKLVESVDFAILIGPLSEQYMVPILRKANFPFENFPNVTSSREAILKLIQSKDIILVKGSQNTLFLERIVELLLADKSDTVYLTRRGEYWDKIRSQTP